MKNHAEITLYYLYNNKCITILISLKLTDSIWIPNVVIHIFVLFQVATFSRFLRADWWIQVTMWKLRRVWIRDLGIVCRHYGLYSKCQPKICNSHIQRTYQTGFKYNQYSFTSAKREASFTSTSCTGLFSKFRTHLLFDRLCYSAASASRTDRRVHETLSTKRIVRRKKTKDAPFRDQVSLVYGVINILYVNHVKRSLKGSDY
jgi:hypothetical protein